MNPPNGFIEPFGGFKSGDAARCIDELFYVPGAFGLVVLSVILPLAVGYQPI